jgi:hypothetical protein
MKETSVQPIMSLEQRLARWESCRSKRLRQQIVECAIVLVAVMLTLFSLCYFSNRAFGITEAFTGITVAIGLMIPPILLRRKFDRKPTQDDLDADVELRSHFLRDS